MQLKKNSFPQDNLKIYSCIHTWFVSYEPHCEKTEFLPMRKQRCRTAKLISAFVFATWIVQFLFLLNPKF